MENQISLSLVIVLLVAHFIADFVCQTDWMAKGKSSSDIILSIHVGVYSLMMYTVLAVFKGLMDWNISWNDALAQTGYILIFVGLNGMAHFITDYWTSRATSKLWKSGQVHWFFVVIGADQMLHVAVLMVMASWTGL